MTEYDKENFEKIRKALFNTGADQIQYKPALDSSIRYVKIIGGQEVTFECSVSELENKSPSEFKREFWVIANLRKVRLYDHEYEMNVSRYYTAIKELKGRLDMYDIPYKEYRIFDGYRLEYKNGLNVIYSAVQHMRSEGSEKNLIELGGIGIGHFEGNLTAEQAFKKIVKHAERVGIVRIKK